MTHRCQVCDEVFNKSSRSLVNCIFCDYKSCSGCNERYLLETTQDAHCMSCRKGWSREVLTNNFTYKFVSKTYKERRENLLFDREKSMMPATQVYVELEKEHRDLEKKKKELEKKYNDENFKYREIVNTQLAVIAVAENVSTEYEAMIIRLKRSQEQNKVLQLVQIDMATVSSIQQHILNRLNGSTIQLEKRAFVRACPGDGCKGFLSTAWKCGLCENWACSTCHEIKGLDKDSPHTCDPGNVATAELLARDSRNCPSCASIIFKINGCDQMWCTQCHTAFSWRTGRIETHTIHNPHYYEYQRAHGTLPRQPGDMPCGGLPEWYTFQRYLYNIHGSTNYSIISQAFRSHGHAQYVILPRYTIDARNENRDLRIKFMIGDIDENNFKKKIQQREKAINRKTDIRQVVEMYLTVVLDIIQSFTENRETQNMVDNLKGLRNHYNSTLEKIQFCYKCAVPTLLDNFNFVY